MSVAKSDSRIYALLSVITGLKPIVAIAFVRARQVDAISVLTGVRVFGTLVDVSTFVRTDLSVSLGTDTSKRPDQVLAREFTIVCRRQAFVDVLAVSTVWCKCVSVRAYAPKRSGNVVTTESTLIGHFQTLVDVFADLRRSRSKSVGADAFKAALQVRTRPIPTNVYVYLALVLVDAFFTS